MLRYSRYFEMKNHLQHNLRSATSVARRLTVQLVAAVSLVTAAIGSVHADDTEIFRSKFELGTDGPGRPKVLIMFDDSGSMSSTVPNSKDPYDPSITYPTQGGIQDGRLYWSVGAVGNPPGKNDANWFDASSYRCASSVSALASGGIYSGQVARWEAGTIKSSKNNTYYDGQWKKLSTSVHAPPHVDCYDDIRGVDGSPLVPNPGNINIPDGFPIIANGNNTPYGTLNQSIGSDWQAVRIYTANYMNYYYGPSSKDKSRIQVAQETIISLIRANPGVDFGLGVFNKNSGSTSSNNPKESKGRDRDGGRIVQRIIENMSQTDRDNLVGIVNQFRPDGSTPLCESMYEVYLYLSGGKVLYGDRRAYDKDYPNDYTKTDQPDRDLLAENPTGTYVSPAGACEHVYVILMTDGLPSSDTAANTTIENLIKTRTGEDRKCKSYLQDNGGTAKNCLPDLAEFMYTQDLDGDADNGTQNAVTYTISFGLTGADSLLQDTSRLGGGLNYSADTADELAAAFQGALTSILSQSSSFTAPSVAVDTFTRTESRNEVFFAMFEPQRGTDWPGNIKKLRIDIGVDADNNPAAVLKDADDIEALDGSGKIADSARTFWSASADGSAVAQGGVGELLADRDPDTRAIYSNTGTAGALESFESANVTASRYSVADDNALQGLFGVNSRAELDDLLAWARGWKDGSARKNRRDWILGDMLHSRPLVLNYGARSGYTKADPDIRVVVGTNAGFLHMFNNSDGKENWAFFPKELAAVLKPRFENLMGGDVVWGVDGSAVYYSYDANRDGTIDHTAGDKLYLYFGLRRGGNAYYALDISDPDNPQMLWKIDGSMTGFEELGETWSQPLVTYIAGYRDAAKKPKPVLVFGGGYDTALDNVATVASTVAGGNPKGRAIYIVDAATGALVWSVSPAGDSTTNLQETGFEYPIPAQLAVLDSNGDGLTDRIYATDTGGNIWRVDLLAIPDPSDPPNKVIPKGYSAHFAALNTATSDSNHSGDRRFFYPVDLVRTMARKGGGVFDAVLVGSGDRENPNATDNDDRFYMLRDRHTGIFGTAAPTSGDCTATPPVNDTRCTWPLNDSDLYDATSNEIQTGATPEDRATALGDLNGKNGWFVSLQASDGEKSLARSVTIDGVVYFTTFAPQTEDNDNMCEPSGGIGRFYAVRLLDATAAINFDNDPDTFERFARLGVLIPDAPAPHFGSDKRIRLLFPSGGGIKNMKNPLDTGARLRAPYGTYWYSEEY